MRLLTAILISIFHLTWAQESPHIWLDTHLHYFPEDDGFLGIEPWDCEKEKRLNDLLKIDPSSYGCVEDPVYNYQTFLNSQDTKVAFLISSSFEVVNKEPSKAVKVSSEYRKFAGWAFDEKYIPYLDRHVSGVAQKSKGRLLGLCGLNYSWKQQDAHKYLDDCLKLPGMVGIKIHSFSSLEDRLLNNVDKRNAFLEILGQVEQYRPVILWHIKTYHCREDETKNCGSEEIQVAFEAARKFPKLNIIMAHSLWGEDLEYLIELERKHGSRLNNLFLETSAANPRTLIPLWQEFGWDRVLFGSDNFPNAKTKLMSELKDVDEALQKMEAASLRIIQQSKASTEMIRLIKTN